MYLQPDKAKHVTVTYTAKLCVFMKMDDRCFGKQVHEAKSREHCTLGSVSVNQSTVIHIPLRG